MVIIYFFNARNLMFASKKLVSRVRKNGFHDNLFEERISFTVVSKWNRNKTK